jgi:hypothetical protein
VGRINHESLPDPVFAEATGVLEMIARNPEERQLYEVRLKAERDEWARIAQAELEVRLEERVRTIKVLRDIVGDTSPSDAALSNCYLDELASIEAGLQRCLRERS